MRGRSDDVCLLPPGQGRQDAAEGLELPARRPDAAPAAAAAAGEGDAEAPKPKYAWRCKVCGHIEYGDELPDDFTCPVCSVGPDMFERIEL